MLRSNLNFMSITFSPIPNDKGKHASFAKNTGDFLKHWRQIAEKIQNADTDGVVHAF